MKRGVFGGEDFVSITEQDDPNHVLSWAQYAVKDGIIKYRLEDIDTEPGRPPRSCKVSNFATLLELHFGKIDPKRI